MIPKPQKTYAIMTEGDLELIFDDFRVAMYYAIESFTVGNTYSLDELTTAVWPYFVRSLRGKTFYTMELIIAETKDYQESSGDLMPYFTTCLAIDAMALWGNACAFDPDYVGLGREPGRKILN